MPKARGSSGPTTTRSAFMSSAASTRAVTSWAGMSRSLPRLAMPGLPGAMRSSVQRGDWRFFHARACSRPPEPMRRIFIEQDSPMGTKLRGHCSGFEG